MDIVLENVGKRFRYEWIFKDIHHTFQSGKIYGLLGPNGSGKSTLLKIISGHLSPSTGKVNYLHGGQTITREHIYKRVGFTGPYIELIEELSLKEAVEFHRQFKPLLDDWSSDEFAALIGLSASRDKEIANFSSGMKQRLKLALCICSQSDFLLIDEPNTNLDAEAAQWFQSLLKKYHAGRTVIIASNEQKDFALCDEMMNIKNFSTKTTSS